MNLPRLFTGCLRALKGAPDWEEYFDFSRQSFYLSFLAVLMSAPFYILCAQIIVQQRAQHFDQPAYLPLGSFLLLYGLYALMFVLVTYMITLVFDRKAVFRPWVIVRQWTFFFLALLAGLIACINLLGWLGFQLALYGLLIVSLAGLIIDICLGRSIGGFDWGPSILTACLITAMNLMVLLIGMAQSV